MIDVAVAKEVYALNPQISAEQLNAKMNWNLSNGGRA